VNLTCGRNPWKSASPKDSTFRAYLEDRHFLKTILPLSDELNDILGMIFEVDPSRRIRLPELRQRIINCQQFTKTALPAPIYVDPLPYQEPLSPTSTISDEGSMISDHSDDSTAPSEVDPTPEEDFSSFEVMEEDCDFNLDPAFQGPVPDALPPPKVIPKVWNVNTVVPVENLQDSSLKPYVPPRSFNPFDHGSSRLPSRANFTPFVFTTPGKPAGSRPPAQHHTKATREARSGPIIVNHCVAPTSQLRGHAAHGSTGFASKAHWAKRSYPRDRPTLRGLHQWQLREFIGHSLPHRIY
jgi:hypothetical protein